MGAELMEALLADDVFHTAGVLGRRVPGYAEPLQKRRQDLMPLINQPGFF
jgi:hypothetical protein